MLQLQSTRSLINAIMQGNVVDSLNVRRDCNVSWLCHVIAFDIMVELIEILHVSYIILIINLFMYIIVKMYIFMLIHWVCVAGSSDTCGWYKHDRHRTRWVRGRQQPGDAIVLSRGQKHALLRRLLNACHSHEPSHHTAVFRWASDCLMWSLCCLFGNQLQFQTAKEGQRKASIGTVDVGWRTIWWRGTQWPCQTMQPNKSNNSSQAYVFLKLRTES